MRLNPREIMPMANRITKTSSLLFSQDVNMYSVRLLVPLTCDACNTQIHSGLWLPYDSFHDLLGKAPVFPQLIAVNLAHQEKILTGG